MRNILTFLFCYTKLKIRINEKYRFLQKCVKIQKIIARKILILETSGWCHLKKKISSFLAVNIKRCIIPGGKWLNFRKCLKLKMKNLKSPVRFKKSNYVIRLFSNNTFIFFSFSDSAVTEAEPDNDVPSSIREDALEKVRTFLWGSWKEVKNEDIIVSRIK